VAARRAASYLPLMTTPAEEDWRDLYAEAFRRFFPSVLWSYRQVPDPKPANGLSISHALKQQGGMAARRFAERLERACHAA
jgi:hypothetical protein